MTTRATGSYQVWTPGTTTVYEYVYNGDKLSQMTVGSDMLNFSYDASGTPMTVQYNGTTYYYVTNIQGDVIAILDSNGTVVVEYAYDAWGNHISSTENTPVSPHALTNLNPLRYRGYVYDQEYEFYYLQSRYYDPEIGRFLNADVTVSTGQRFVGCNMYAYCINNPTNYLDWEGTDAVWIQEKDTVPFAGHTGLLIEKEDGKWYFFYWGMESETIDFENVLKAVSGTKAKLVWKEIETDNCDLATTTGIKEALQMSGDPDVNRSELVTDTLYYTGDFSKTFEYIERLSQEQQQYNLLTNNCVQQSTKALKNSSFDFSFTKAVIPNVAFRRARVLNCLRNFFD